MRVIKNGALMTVIITKVTFSPCFTLRKPIGFNWIVPFCLALMVFGTLLLLSSNILMTSTSCSTHNETKSYTFNCRKWNCWNECVFPIRFGSVARQKSESRFTRTWTSVSCFFFFHLAVIPISSGGRNICFHYQAPCYLLLSVSAMLFALITLLCLSCDLFRQISLSLKKCPTICVRFNWTIFICGQSCRTLQLVGFPGFLSCHYCGIIILCHLLWRKVGRFHIFFLSA